MFSCRSSPTQVPEGKLDALDLFPKGQAVFSMVKPSESDRTLSQVTEDLFVLVRRFEKEEAVAWKRNNGGNPSGIGTSEKVLLSLPCLHAAFWSMVRRWFIASAPRDPRCPCWRQGPYDFLQGRQL